ncbi:hypothetical protein PRECH8_08620 [Insulibacter thermoxylanivorax]|uniref:Uncharacterized protein n=1 Tax=Insulibacter thermoxylanivorax TaxID=2749268 RepID=A0A916VFM3_9BACL|nr:hypothetical protein [Insulibacter thermoxylanivorax]GFR37566.1 hypothetical protein PRECH8_08620 [Insulibacter thermoxylanivorax]
MYNQQSYHTSNYRGNIQGHDRYLRSDSQQPSSSMQSSGYATSSYNTPVTSQYRGIQRTFQPTGFVQSVYGQGSQQALSSSSVSSQYQSPASYHMSNYRGNQPGHDNYLRSDSQQPSGYGSYGSYGNTGNYGGYGSASMTSQYQASVPASSQSLQSSAGSTSAQYSPYQSQYSQSQYTQQSQQYNSPQQYHLANYQGNQPGHDQDLRSDSNQPSAFGRSFF